MSKAVAFKNLLDRNQDICWKYNQQRMNNCKNIRLKFLSGELLSGILIPAQKFPSRPKNAVFFERRPK
jgi:hypothetical protein